MEGNVPRMQKGNIGWWLSTHSANVLLICSTPIYCIRCREGEGWRGLRTLQGTRFKLFLLLMMTNPGRHRSIIHCGGSIPARSQVNTVGFCCKKFYTPYIIKARIQPIKFNSQNPADCELKRNSHFMDANCYAKYKISSKGKQGIQVLRYSAVVRRSRVQRPKKFPFGDRSLGMNIFWRVNNKNSQTKQTLFGKE